MATLYAVAKCARAEMFYGNSVIEIKETIDTGLGCFAGKIDDQLLNFSIHGHLKNFDIYFTLFARKDEAKEFASDKNKGEAVKNMLSSFDVDADVLDERDIKDLVRIHNKLSFAEVK